jgi:ketosteroid isomerase-like protein
MKYFMTVVAVAAVMVGVASSASGQSDRAVERAVRAATVVVEAEAKKYNRPSSSAVVEVLTKLKGEVSSQTIDVDFEKAPLGLWPQLGEVTILCLAERGAGKYELASYSASVLPTDNDIRVVIEQAAMPVVVSPMGEPSGTGESTEVVDAPKNVLATRASMSETVLVGMLSNVQEDKSGAIGTFAVEKALMGFGGYGEPVTVQFPVSAGTPEAGKYALFLRARPSDGGFTVVSSKWGIVPIADDAAETKLKDEFADIGASTDKLSSIQATAIAWQDAWNKRDLAACMKCYSPSNHLRKQYDSSIEARSRLKADLDAFPGKVSLTIQKIQTTRSTLIDATAGADVTVLLAITVPDGKEDRRDAVMKFVNQDGEWLVLDEGF